MFGAPTSKAMVRPMRLVVLAFVVAFVGLHAVGCGGGQGTTVALPVLHELGPVADATENADSASFDLGFEFRMGGLDMPLGFTASGAYDTPAKKAELTMDLGSFAKMMSGFAGAVGGDAPKELGDPAKWKLEMRLDGTTAYMRMPFMASQLPSGKEWVGIDLARAAQMQGRDLGELQSLAQGSDPRQMLTYLRSIAGEVTHVGDEEVRGVPTAHYFAVVDWQKALEHAAKQSGQPGLLDQFQGFGGSMSNIPVDVWVDEQSRLRRMTMDFSMSAGSQEAGGSLRLELFDYGEAVDVDAPPASDVVDAFSLKR
jgi:hypothetical protein